MHGPKVASGWAGRILMRFLQCRQGPGHLSACGALPAVSLTLVLATIAFHAVQAPMLHC